MILGIGFRQTWPAIMHNSFPRRQFSPAPSTTRTMHRCVATARQQRAPAVAGKNARTQRCNKQPTPSRQSLKSPLRRQKRRRYKNGQTPPAQADCAPSKLDEQGRAAPVTSTPRSIVRSAPMCKKTKNSTTQTRPENTHTNDLSPGVIVNAMFCSKNSMSSW